MAISKPSRRRSPRARCSSEAHHPERRTNAGQRYRLLQAESALLLEPRANNRHSPKPPALRSRPVEISCSRCLALIVQSDCLFSYQGELPALARVEAPASRRERRKRVHDVEMPGIAFIGRRKPERIWPSNPDVSGRGSDALTSSARECTPVAKRNSPCGQRCGLQAELCSTQPVYKDCYN